MIKYNRNSFFFAVIILLVAAGLRLWHFTTFPPGFHAQEILDIRLAENARQGYIQVFYNLGGEGREGLYHTLLTAVTLFTGGGLVDYHILSVWLGLLTVSLTYALTRRLYGNLAGLSAMALLAFSLFPILLSRTVGRETILPLFTSVILLALALGLPVYWRRRSTQTLTTAFAALGLIIGISFYIHPAGLLIALCGLVYVVYVLMLRQHITRQLLSYISFSALLALIVATPYLVSALRLPHLGGVARLVGGFISDGTAPLQRALNALLGLGFVGDTSPLYNLPNRPMFDPLSALVILLGIVAALRYVRKPRYALPLISAVILLPLALLSPVSPSFLAFSAVLPVLAVLFGLGVTIIANRMPNRSYLHLALAALMLFNLAWTTYDLFGQWQNHPDVKTAYNTRLMQLAHRIDQTSADIPTVICTRQISAETPRQTLTNGQIISLMQHRFIGQTRYVDCNHGMVFINGGGLQQVIMTEPEALLTMNPFILDWLQRARPVIGREIPEDSVLMMEVASALANTVGRFTTTTPVILPPEATGDHQELLPPVAFGGNLTFLGYQVPSVDYYPPGGIVTVTTYWRVDGTLPPDLQLFTHIISDPAARPVAQSDTISIVPTELENRDIFIQVAYVPLSKHTVPSLYTVSTGAYQDSDKRRMDVLSRDGGRISDRLFLYGIDVRPVE